MKNTIFKLLEYLYYFSLVSLFILYLFPGSLIGYFLYGNFAQQPDLIPNPIGTSINHLIFFTFLLIQFCKKMCAPYALVLVKFIEFKNELST